MRFGVSSRTPTKLHLFGFLALLWLVTTPPSVASIGLSYDQAVYDFGCVDFDFDVMHTYKLINRGQDTVNIKDIEVNCDCTYTWISEKTLAPGDTVELHLRWNTADFYGYVNKSVIVRSDDSFTPELKLFYRGTVGKWDHQLTPSPSSVIILPPADSKKVTIKNPVMDEVIVTDLAPEAEFFTVVALKARADKSESLEIDVRPREGLSKGTHQSSFRVTLEIPGADKPVHLSIPVKIVRY